MAKNKKRRPSAARRSGQRSGTKPNGSQNGAKPDAAQGGGAKASTQGSERPASGAKASSKPQGGSSKARPASKSQQRQSSSAKRAAQRRAQKRKRQMLTWGTGAAIAAAVLFLIFVVGGGLKGGGEFASAGSITVDGSSRSSTIPVGSPVPSFTAPGLKGGTVSYSKGEPSVISVWAAWCPHCQVELPKLNAAQSDYPGVKFLSINTAQGQNPGPTPKAFVAEKKITMPVAIDDQAQTLLHAFGVTSFPTLYFVNADGTVYKQTAGEPADSYLQEAMQHLQSQASSTPSPAASPSPKK